MLVDTVPMLLYNQIQPEGYGTYFLRHIRTLQKARKGQYVAEVQERVRRALRMSTRARGSPAALGDVLDYYCEQDTKRGPQSRGTTVVVRVEANLLLIRQGEGYCQL